MHRVPKPCQIEFMITCLVIAVQSLMFLQNVAPIVFWLIQKLLSKLSEQRILLEEYWLLVMTCIFV